MSIIQSSKIIQFIILNQIFVCYISSFIHKSFTQILHFNTMSFLYTFDSASELIHTITRVIFLFFITKISFKKFKNTYILASVSLVFTTGIFLFCQLINFNFLFCFSWIINRICVGIISATRDYIMYREIYRSNLNIPLIKVLKSFGNIMTLLSIIFLYEQYITTGFCLLVTSLFNLQISLYTVKILEKNNKENTESYQKDKEEQNSVTNKVNIKSALIVMTVMTLISSNLLSDQLIYVEIGSDLGFKLKFLGQTVIGLLYAFILKNNVYASASFGLIASISYLLIVLGSYYLKLLGIVMYGLIYTIKNTSYLTIPKYLTKYNQNYQAIAFIFESLVTFISSLFFERYLLSKYLFNKSQSYIIYSVIGLIGWIIAMFIISSVKKSKNKSEINNSFNQDNNINKK